MKDYLMSVVIGDMCGVPYEFKRNRIRKEEEVDLNHPRQRFSDDSVCTFAVADYFLSDRSKSLDEILRRDCKRIPSAGYGGMFRRWLYDSTMGPYGSFGNGSAMRVSSVSLFANTEEECIKLATETCNPTHNHPGAITGAIVTALLGFKILHGEDGKECAKAMLKEYYPEWIISYKDLQKSYCFRPSAQETVPAALIAFIESTSFEDCIIKNIALSGDADTLCAIACPWAYAYYKEMPKYLKDRAEEMIPDWMFEINEQMNDLF